jgi:hypothetical protein
MKGNMHEILKVGQSPCGRFVLDVFELSEEVVKMERMRAMFNRRNFEVIGLEAGTYVKLVDKHRSEIVMSDTGMEIYTNRNFVRNSNGNVLIGGLGIGYVLTEISKKESVKSITVIEKFKEVIDLVLPQLPEMPNVQVIHADIFEWLPEKGTKYDTIYFDIWNNITSDNYPEMKKLHSRFRKFLNKENPNYFLDSWRLDCCKRMDKEDRRYNNY